MTLMHRAVGAIVGVLTFLAVLGSPAGAQVGKLVDPNMASESELSEVPLGRPGKPEEVAALVAWLCTEEAAYVTGSSYVMDGGLLQQVVAKPG